jgi:rare lipoprotein A
MRSQWCRAAGLALLLVAALSACGHSSRAPRPAPPSPKQETPAGPFQEQGLALWYGSFHAGQRTASGDVFDPDAMTAGHRTLPMGAIVWVTNLANGKGVKVRINDRGPGDTTRIIALTRAAAQALGFSTPSSEMKVKIERIDD